jgi:VanZ family protein
MKKKYAFLIVFLTGGTIFFLSSIPGLRVLPVLKHIYELMRRADSVFAKAAEFIAYHIPESAGYFNPVRSAGYDFYSYARSNPAIIEFLLRKAAHITVFFFLTLGIFLLVSQFLKSASTRTISTLMISISLAFLDEYRQSFVPGRTGSLLDVMVDSIGILLAMFFIIFALIYAKWVNNKPYS